ncbi:MAG: hypothetical protein V1875_04940 [Candidatus Altiarchaeota archaeon]
MTSRMQKNVYYINAIRSIGANPATAYGPGGDVPRHLYNVDLMLLPEHKATEKGEMLERLVAEVLAAHQRLPPGEKSEWDDLNVKLIKQGVFTSEDIEKAILRTFKEQMGGRQIYEFSGDPGSTDPFERIIGLYNEYLNIQGRRAQGRVSVASEAEIGVDRDHLGAKPPTGKHETVFVGNFGTKQAIQHSDIILMKRKKP